MSIKFEFDSTVGDEAQKEFSKFSGAIMPEGYEIRPGDLVEVYSTITGKPKNFAVRQRCFQYLPDSNGFGSVLILLGEPSETELTP